MNASRRGIPFAWDDLSDSQLKTAIDRACTAQVASRFFPSGCGTGFAVYVPGGVNYQFRPMNQTGAHTVAALGGNNGGFPQPPGRAVWFYPARSLGGQAAMSAGFQRNWYDKNPLFLPNACTGRAAGTTCDEFPFWTTNQAVNLSGLVADIQPAPTTESLPQASDISGFYSQCQVNDNERFLVLPIKPWVDAGGPSFGFRVSDGGASICMAPRL